MRYLPRSIYKIGAIFLFLLFCFNFKILNAQLQYRYSIDIETKNSRRVPLKYTVNEAKENFKESTEHRKKKRIELKLSKQIRKHIYSIQTREVKKRMRKSRKKAEYFNREKVPLSVKLKKMFKWKM